MPFRFSCYLYYQYPGIWGCTAYIHLLTQ